MSREWNVGQFYSIKTSEMIIAKYDKVQMSRNTKNKWKFRPYWN